jgi:hypothetical protein
VLGEEGVEVVEEAFREVVGPARGESPSAPHPSSKTLDLECSQ